MKYITIGTRLNILPLRHKNCLKTFLKLLYFAQDFKRNKSTFVCIRSFNEKQIKIIFERK